MKNTIKPTKKEIVMSENDLIISKTNPQGKIIYGNRDFIRFSGFKENELLRQPHNIVRHPDMPRAIFKLMWTNLHKKKEFFGCIKNMAKDGSFYWTFANVTPSYDEDNEVNGYFSVRRKAFPSAIEYFSKIYQNMLEEEKQSTGSNDDILDASLDILFYAIKESGGEKYDEFMFNY